MKDKNNSAEIGDFPDRCKLNWKEPTDANVEVVIGGKSILISGRERLLAVTCVNCQDRQI